MRQITTLSRDPKNFEHLFNLLKNKDGFKEDVEKIRKIWNVDLSNQTLVIIGDDESLIDLLKKHNLPLTWKYLISIYIQTGEFESMGDPEGIEIEVSEDLSYGLIKISPETPLTDVKKAFTFIKNKLPKSNSRRRIPEKAYEDTLIYELSKQQGKPYKEVKEVLKDNAINRGDESDLSRKKHKIKERIRKKFSK